jgi:hypothetical protein
MERLERCNLALAAGLKFALIVLLVVGGYAGVVTYDQYSHSGPSCEAQEESFQFWLDAEAEDKPKLAGVIVSVNKAKLQPFNGTTQCFGWYRMEDDSGYKTWEGAITDLEDGSVIGKASL